MKFAGALMEVEVLSYYDRPFLVLYLDQTTGQHWVAAWIDESPEGVQWHMIAISQENLTRLLETDIDKAITLKTAIETSEAVYFCEANTFDYGSITDGERVVAIEDAIMPRPGSYIRMEAFLAYEARKRG
jgi:hypothetical protein